MARGQNRFLSSLYEDKLIRKLSIPLSREPILILTPKGKRMAMLQDEKYMTVITSPSKITTSTIPHLLAVQKSIVAFHDRSQPFLSERYLFWAHTQKRPDGLIVYQNKSTALETEITPKYKQRLFYVFRHHLGMLKDKQYEHVLYCFDKQSTCDFYQQLFDTPHWPVIVYHRQHGHYRPKKSANNNILQFDPSSYRDAFSFRMMPDA